MFYTQLGKYNFKQCSIEKKKLITESFQSVNIPHYIVLLRLQKIPFL